MWHCNLCTVCDEGHRSRARDRRGRRGGWEGKEEPRTLDAAAMPTINAAVGVVALEEENEWRAGELLTAYGSIETKTMTTRSLQQ
jgi:hypothetical protein